MSAEAFRFIHASDFHLEQPLYGFGEAPEPLRDILIDAPYRAAEQVFETARLEEVDFVLLSGDILQIDEAGPRGVAFLLEQFDLLNEKEIAVYWCGGEVDAPRHWPTEVNLPKNVHLFRAGKVEELTHYRGEQPLASIVGQSHKGRRRLRPAEFHPDTTGQFTIAVAYGSCDAEALAKQKIHYWALGGWHRRQPLAESPLMAHYPGSPQGRCPSESGPHGCTLVHVDREGQIQPQFITTDVVRWHTQQVTPEVDATSDDLQELLVEEMQRFQTDAAKQAMFISWQIEATGQLAARLRHGGLAEEMLGQLRSLFADHSPPMWSISLTSQPPESYPDSWHEEDTIRGDFLRCARRYREDASEPLELEAFLSERHAAGSLGAAIQFTDSQQRNQVLHEATALSVDLLHGEDVLDHSSNRTDNER